MRDLFKNSPRDNPEKRMDFMETVIRRVARKYHGAKSKALITPFPISSATFGEKVEGPILRYMFPSDGMVTKGIIKFGKKPKSEVFVELSMAGSYEAASKGYNVIKKMVIVEPMLNVKAGDCLEISIKPDDVDPVTEVWISFLWVPEVGETFIKQFLVEELENDLLEAETE